VPFFQLSCCWNVLKQISRRIFGPSSVYFMKNFYSVRRKVCPKLFWSFLTVTKKFKVKLFTPMIYAQLCEMQQVFSLSLITIGLSVFFCNRIAIFSRFRATECQRKKGAPCLRCRKKYYYCLVLGLVFLAAADRMTLVGVSSISG